MRTFRDRKKKLQDITSILRHTGRGEVVLLPYNCRNAVEGYPRVLSTVATVGSKDCLLAGGGRVF